MDDATEDCTNNGNHSERERGEACESIDEQKNKLKQQIRELKSIILQMECNLDLLKFGNVNCNFRLNTTESQKVNEIANVNIQLQNHLYRYSGFHCVKFEKKEYVFNFSSLRKYDKKHTFAVQILNMQDEAVLGKWVMPMGIDLNELESQISLNNLKNVPRFLRTCKHYVDCYFIRDEQYTLLMDISSQIKNCSIQTNLGYTQVVLDLMGVYDEDDDSCMNLHVYLFYHINETRPYKIVIDSMEKAILNKSKKKCIEESLKCFKNLDLHIAFGHMLNEKPFIWTREDDEDSPLPIDSDTNSDEEGFLESFPLQQTRSTNLSRQRKRRKKNAKVSRISKDLNKSVSAQSKKRTFDSLNQDSVAARNTDAIESTSNLNNTRHRRLRQSKLNFVQSTSNLRHSANLVCSEASTSVDKDINKRPNEPFTSTPISCVDKHYANNIASINVDISDISVNGNNLDCTTKKTRTKEKVRSQNSTPRKLLQSKMKKKLKYDEPK